jgi:hypothetical protein
MANCHIHPSTPGVLTVNARHYCTRCQADIVRARTRVDRHVEPRDCFVWYEGGTRGWQPIPGTGCAHWLLHQLGRRSGGGPTCLDGYPVRVSAVTVGRPRVAIENVRVNDIYVTPSTDHTGLVLRVVHPTRPGEATRITIRHDSSAQGRVSDNDFATYFRSRGNFYR